MSPLIVAGLVSACLFAASCYPSSGAPVGAVGAIQGSGKVITNFDEPFLFAYLAWDKRVRTENGIALLRGAGVTPKGGAGGNVSLDLSASANLCPVVRVKIGAKNTLKMLKMMLDDDSGTAASDAEKRSAIFEYPLPDKPTDGFVTIYPRNGATLAKPNAAGAKGAVDVAKIRQWQLQGDWGGDGAVDVEVDSITLAEPDAKAKQAQVEADKEGAAKQAQAKADRDSLYAKYGKRTASSPNVVETYRVAPDIIAVGIQAGKVIIKPYEAYVKQDGDETRKDGEAVILKRGGKEIGYLLGEKRDGLKYFETFVGDPLLDDPTESLTNYSVISDTGAVVKPVALWRKSKPTDQVQPGATLAMRHVVYLKLPAPLPSGKAFTVKFGDALNIQQSEFALSTDDNAVRSEAVHVPQIGYRADDPIKMGFLSIWLGTGGGYEYPAPPKFAVIHAKTNKPVLTGVAKMAKGKNQADKMWQGKSANYAKTAVYHLDYSALTAPGTYRVAVEGVGASYPFTVGADTWKKAFVTQMRGLFHQRSGVALGEPYTTYKRPRALYPGADVEAFETKYNVVDGDGKTEAGEALEKMATTTPVPEAWGGYHDAGDFNPRRVTHMRVTMAHLELLDIFPTYFGKIKLNIPPKPGVPDVLTEALFELDVFRRLQKPDGGIPFQIETNGDPNIYEVSWKQTKAEYVTAPDPWASWYYAGVAARAAKLLQKYDPKLAATYRASAIKAMEWGEADYKKRKANGTADKIRWDMTDARNYAALLCYDLTGDAKWNAMFMENTVLKEDKPGVFNWGTAVQRDAAFLYATLPASREPDAAMKTKAIAALSAQADSALVYAGGNAFKIATPDSGKPMFIGFWSTPDAIELCRAHFLTGDKKYLAGAVAACAFASGGNPSNITYTTGVGANPVKHPFQIDYRATGQAPPEGLTVYGNFDWPNWPDQAWALWPMQYSLGPGCKPTAYDWPVPEAFFDIYLYPAIAEYTVDAWTPNVYVWGYLAARK